MSANERPQLRVRRQELQEAAGALGITRDYLLAEELGVDKSTLCLLLAGKRQPSERFITAVLVLFDRPFEDFFEIDMPAAVAA